VGRAVLQRIVAALAVAACVSQNAVGSATAAGPTAPAPGSLQVLITTSELVVGQNRFAFGLLKDHTFFPDAKVIVRLWDIREPDAQLTAEVPATYHKLEVIEQGKRVHIHPDGTRHVHAGATDVQGIYAAHATFPRPGPWGVEVVVRRGPGAAESARMTVEVLDVAGAPLPGTPAPRSRNLVASDVSDLRQIDSSDPPDPRLHQTRIADAIAGRRPQVIVFATPKYCTSRICGPVVDVVRTLIPTYGRRVAFIHQEIWSSPLQTFASTVEEWNLRTEPWIFVVDAHGMIRARFEGLTTRSELEAVLKSMLRPD
jgi:hypothetical protein